MKLIIPTILVAVACSPVVAAEPNAASPSSSASPVVAETTSTPTPEGKTVVAQPVKSASNFCGQAEIYRLLMKTEFGKQLQLQQQEALRQAIAQAVAEGKISAQQSQPPVVPSQQSTQAVPALPVKTEIPVPQK
jgi:hypothetical protein